MRWNCQIGKEDATKQTTFGKNANIPQAIFSSSIAKKNNKKKMHQKSLMQIFQGRNRHVTLQGEKQKNIQLIKSLSQIEKIQKNKTKRKNKKSHRRILFLKILFQSVHIFFVGFFFWNALIVTHNQSFLESEPLVRPVLESGPLVRPVLE